MSCESGARLSSGAAVGLVVIAMALLGVYLMSTLGRYQIK